MSSGDGLSKADENSEDPSRLSSCGFNTFACQVETSVSANAEGAASSCRVLSNSDDFGIVSSIGSSTTGVIGTFLTGTPVCILCCSLESGFDSAASLRLAARAASFDTGFAGALLAVGGTTARVSVKGLLRAAIDAREGFDEALAAAN